MLSVFGLRKQQRTVCYETFDSVNVNAGASFPFHCKSSYNNFAITTVSKKDEAEGEEAFSPCKSGINRFIGQPTLISRFVF